MTTGKLMFYAGIGLLGITVILAIVFLIARPKYKPENAVYNDAGRDAGTQRLRNGYPTERVTVTRGKAKAGTSTAASAPVNKAAVSDDKTELLDTSADSMNSDHTEVLL